MIHSIQQLLYIVHVFDAPKSSPFLKKTLASHTGDQMMEQWRRGRKKGALTFLKIA